MVPNLMITLACFAIADRVTGRISLALAVGVMCCLVLGGGAIWAEWPLGNASNIYGRELKVISEPLGAYPSTSDQHMVTVSDQNALNIANRAMSQDIPGSNASLGSRYTLGDCELQSVLAHMYYICGLRLSGTANNRADQYTIPGYIVVDAENPDATPQARLGYHMVYTPGAPFGHSITRLIYGWNRNLYVDDLTLEVNDQWRPEYTASVDSPPVRWQQAVPVAFITVDPQTGRVTRYPLDRIPAWVDRVYSQTMAEDMLNWWGQWGAVPWNVQGCGGRYQVDGAPTLVYTSDGPAWQALLTSQNNDTAVSYIALMDTRSKIVRLYHAPEGLTLQSTAIEAIDSSANNLKSLDPVDLALHEIYGRLEWVAPLVPKGTATQPGDELTAEPSAGMALLTATDPNASGVVIGQTKADALTQLAVQIANATTNPAPGATSIVKTVTGTVAGVDQVVISGQTYVLLELKGEVGDIYRGQISGNTARNLAMGLVHAGDRVTVTFVNTGDPVRNIGALTDSSVPIRG
jgi:hypothetical protein